MAVAFDAAASLDTTGTNAATATLAHTISGANTFLMVYVQTTGNRTDDVSGITWNGTALTRSQFQAWYRSGVNWTHDLWYLLAPETGSHNIVVTNRVDLRNAIVSMSFTGAASNPGVQPNGSHKSGVGSYATSFTHTVSSTIDDCLLVGGVTPEDARNDVSAASGSIIRANAGQMGRAITADGVLASAGSDTLSVTATQSAWGVVSFWVAPAAADPASGNTTAINGIAFDNIAAVN